MSAYKHTVPPEISSVRLSDYGKGIFPGWVSRAGFKKAIKRGEIFVSGEPGTTGTIVTPGMLITWKPGDAKEHKVYRILLDVIFEDNHLAVVRKPGGLVVSGNRFRTLENALSANLSISQEEDALVRPQPVHRLDTPTSGLVIIAKTRSARVQLGNQMEQKKIDKKYTAVVTADTSEQWYSDSPVDDKEALTHFRKIYSVFSRFSGALSMIEARPHTGRTHQIRKHLYRDDLPVLGDKLYAREGFVLKGKELFLCATGLSFPHPVSGKMLNLSIDPPPKFDRFMKEEEKRFLKWS